MEEIAGRFGHERLLFGTGMPVYDPGGPLGLLMGAQISQDQRADMAGNSLRRLLGLPERAAGEAPAWPCGPHGFRVFDVHGHLGRFHSKYHRDWTAEQMVSRMDQVGVERFAVSDFMAIGPDYRKGNDRIGAGVAAFPDRLVGYVVYNPNYESEMADEMARAFGALGCRGIKLHCALHDTSTEDPRYRLAFQTAQEQGCPMLCHTYQGPSPAFLMERLAAFPDAKFIYAHIGGGDREGLKPFVEVAHARPNLFFDPGVLENGPGYAGLAGRAGAADTDPLRVGPSGERVHFPAREGAECGHFGRVEAGYPVGQRSEDIRGVTVDILRKRRTIPLESEVDNG